MNCAHVHKYKYKYVQGINGVNLLIDVILM